MSELFVEGRRQTLLYSRKRQEWERSEKSSKKTQSIISRYRAVTSSEPWNTETNKVDRNAPITSKHVFPKRSAKMIDGTEKPKIPSKFAKRAAGYNEFGYKDHVIEECEGSQSLQWKNFEQSRVILSFVFAGQAGRERCIQPSSQAFSARSFLDSTMSCDVTERYSPRTRSLARSPPDFARTTDQEGTPRD